MFEKIKCFILDMDGTIYLGNELFPFTKDFLKKVEETGREYYFFTNKELCESIKKTNDPNLLDLIDPKILREKTEEIIRIIEEIPKADEIVAMLEKVHGVKSLEDIGFTPDMKEKTARVAPYIRDRITFMRILKFYDFYDDVIK